MVLIIRLVIQGCSWAEKFFDNVYLTEADGSVRGYGETGDHVRDIPRCIGCDGRVANDITLLHWYWSLCTGQEEKDICALARKIFFGNFQMASLKEYRERIKDIEGAFVSNWASTIKFCLKCYFESGFWG